MLCPNCGKETEGNFCTYCGTQISSSHMCVKCGKGFEGNFCPNCGTSVVQQRQTQSSAQYQAQNVQQPPTIIINNANTNTNMNSNYGGGFSSISVKSRWLAFFLCLFVGIFGIHRFYVGKVGTGIIWLFTGGALGIGWVIDLVVIFSGGFRDSYGCYLKN